MITIDNYKEMNRPLLFLLLLLNIICAGQGVTPNNWTHQIDSLFNHVSKITPGYMVAIIQGDKVIFEKGYGAADLEHSILISANTSFNIASLSKQFTAAAIAQLILDGRLDFEDDVKEYFPESNFETGEMKLKHLIYMTSGINDYYYNARVNGSGWSGLSFFNLDTAIRASFSSPLMYKPGEQWSYSNINYMLLTRIVEQVSGKSFSMFSSERIFEPLEMSNTLVNDDIFQIIPQRANAYNHRDAENTDWLIEDGYISRRGAGYLQIHRNSPHYGGSGVYSTMADYCKWMVNFHNKEYGGQPFYYLMHKTTKFDHDKVNDGLGIVHGEYLGYKTTWYEGGDWGYSSYFMRFVDQDFSIVCFSNLGTGNSRKYVNNIAEIVNQAGLLEAK